MSLALNHRTDETWHADVVVVRWPDELAKLRRLEKSHTPRLLLVSPDADPPTSEDCEEDWIRLPAEDRDVSARLHSLSRRAARHPAQPNLDEFGRVHYRGHVVSLSLTESRLAARLVERFGAGVSQDDLFQSGWPNGVVTTNALRMHVMRLRRAIAPAGLEIRVLRASGYVLVDSDTPEVDAGGASRIRQ